MQDINVEMGRAPTYPFTLNDADVRALAGVPSGPISLASFYGKSAATITAGTRSYESRRFAGSGSNNATVTYNADGSVSASSSNATDGTTSTGIPGTPWMSPNVGAAAYEIMGTLSSGTAPTSGPLSTWRSFPASWTWNSAPGGDVDCVLAIAIRHAGGSTISTGQLTLFIDRNA
jgi:hypothetical protein